MLELEAEWEATWVAVVRAKWVEQNEGPGKIDSSIAKAMGGGLARKATQTCIAILGACGLSAEHLAEKWFRDARIFDIYEGTGEIQRLIIARDLLGLLAEGAELDAKLRGSASVSWSRTRPSRTPRH